MSGPNGSDSGDLTSSTLSIEERDGAIVLFIGETYAILPPEQSIAVGELLVQYGYHQKTGQDVDGKKVMSETIRNKLFQRVSLVINNMQDRNKEPMHIAKEIVDIVLTEVL